MKTLEALGFTGRTTVLEVRQSFRPYGVPLPGNAQTRSPYWMRQDALVCQQARAMKRKRSQYLLRQVGDEKRPRLDEEVQRGIDQYKPVTVKLRARLQTTAENAASYGMDVPEMREILQSLDLAFDDLCLT